MKRWEPSRRRLSEPRTRGSRRQVGALDERESRPRPAVADEKR